MSVAGNTGGFNPRTEAVSKGYVEQTKGLDNDAVYEHFNELTSAQQDVLIKVLKHHNQATESSLTLNNHEFKVFEELEVKYAGQMAELTDAQVEEFSKGDEPTPDPQREARLQAREAERSALLRGTPIPPGTLAETQTNTIPQAPHTTPTATPSVAEEPAAPATVQTHVQKEISAAGKAKSIFKDFFKKKEVKTTDEKVAGAEEFLKGRYLEGGKIKDANVAEFTKKDSKAMSEAGMSRGFFKNVGLGVIDQGRRNSQQTELRGERDTLNETLERADAFALSSSNVSQTVHGHLDRDALAAKPVNVTWDLEAKINDIDARFTKLENNLKPFLKNPHYAGQYARDLKDHAHYVHEQKIPALALKHYYLNEKTTPPDPFVLDVNAKIANGMKLTDAIKSALAEDGGLEKAELTGEMTAAHQLEEKAMLWARYAADRGNTLGGLIVADLYFSYGDWSTPEKRKATLEKAIGFAEASLEQTSLKEQKQDAYLAMGALYEKQMHLAAKDLKADPTNPKKSEEFRFAGAMALRAYKDAGGGRGFQGLYNLFRMGSEEAGNAAVGIIRNVTPDVRVRLRILSDAGIQEAKNFLAAKTAEDKDVALTTKVLQAGMPEATDAKIQAQVDLHNQNKSLWEIKR